MSRGAASGATGSAENWGRPSGGGPLAGTGGRITVPSLTAPGGAESEGKESEEGSKSNSDLPRDAFTRAACDGAGTPLLRRGRVGPWRPLRILAANGPPAP